MNGEEESILKVVANNVKWIKDNQESMDKKLDDVCLKVQIHHTTLYGQNSDKGLCGKVEKNTSSIVKLMIIVGVISAGIGGGTAEIVSHFFGG